MNVVTSLLSRSKKGYGCKWTWENISHYT